MTASSPTILALDFDGVICDGLIEYFEVAWLTYCKLWLPDNDTPPDDLALRFYRLRPVIETGWEMPVLIKALLAGMSDEEILQEWTTITPQILLKDNLQAREISAKLDYLRDEWIATDLDGWLSLHRFYPGVIEKIKLTLDSHVQLFIVTTKEGRFVQQLLQQEGVNLPPAAIFGKEVKRPKYEILRELIQAANQQPVSLWFVEDRIKTLQLVQQQADLEDVKLFLADWGYNTQPERKAAQDDEQIQLISLSQFTKNFSDWLS
ncbi:HAD family hydrolase [Nostoc sp. FACHB-87]|uniref:HAD family hydrolase n=1 Tax=Nostocales TaxID=1161 RepID=UPI0016854518|nr:MULTISPECIES: HAD family hydrolase [Nostocales]MBD2300695.1 HAD family hydrolase [Nostoc sp. FACHB-190]MBD2459329.1 HAD family hydrolase [Nostoc sp. FACHB-87]MBD2480328.1 HAD family hydrolase [Anabaena sp. FACHB-83]MBD2489106.1 HAD family hydrolase [Aulosira sp. FACHB-615]